MLPLLPQDFADWFSSDVTVTAFRELDGRIARLLPQTSPELPSEFCDEAAYADKVRDLPPARPPMTFDGRDGLP